MQLYRPARTNPAVDPKQEIRGMVSVDPQVTTVLERACNDCHTNRTTWPWYSNVAPASWLLVSDVQRGRAAMNLSEWGKYGAKEQQEHLKAICSEISEGEMPAFQYTIIHREAKLNAAEKAAVCRWTKSVMPGGAQPVIED
jgi:hypothetical protein